MYSAKFRSSAPTILLYETAPTAFRKMLMQCHKATGVHLCKHTPSKAVPCPVNAPAGFHLSAVVVTLGFDILSLPLHLSIAGLTSTPVMVSPLPSPASFHSWSSPTKEALAQFP